MDKENLEIRGTLVGSPPLLIVGGVHLGLNLKLGGNAKLGPHTYKTAVWDWGK